MIGRIWHGCTSLQNADVYEQMLKNEIIPEIESKGINGYKGFQVLRREFEEETEFTTIIWFETLDSVKDFVGENYEEVYVPEKARRVLKKFDQKAVHYDLKYSSGNIKPFF